MEYFFAPGNDQLALQPMRQQSQIWTSTEDWTGITGPAERRKLQNRLNQRARRSREKLKQDLRASSSDSHEMLDSRTVANGDSLETPGRRICRLGDLKRRALVEEFAMRAQYAYQAGAPCIVHLSTLTKVNVFRALSSNAAILDCSSEWLECEALSNLQADDRGRDSEIPGTSRWPATLRPTTLQQTTSHHPWIDLLPSAGMRDNLLRALNHPGLIDEDELCYDIVDVAFGDEPGQPGLVIWGQPWDPSGWEVDVAFLRKWGWLLQGCQEILEATNYWREKRGDKPLQLGPLMRKVDV